MAFMLEQSRPPHLQQHANETCIFVSVKKCRYVTFCQSSMHVHESKGEQTSEMGNWPQP